jgi:hypothetical protein
VATVAAAAAVATGAAAAVAATIAAVAVVAAVVAAAIAGSQRLLIREAGVRYERGRLSVFSAQLRSAPCSFIATKCGYSYNASSKAYAVRLLGDIDRRSA